MSLRWCKGCRVVCCITLFRFDAIDVCINCTYNVQSCHRIAKSQGSIVLQCNWLFCVAVIHALKILCSGENAWLTESLADSEKFHIITKSYKDHRKAIDQGAKVLSTWPLLEIKNLFIERTSTDVNAEGEFMCRRRFLMWATDRVALYVDRVLGRVAHWRD